MPTSVGTFVPISSALRSIWSTRTPFLKRGGSPKWRIQFNRAPINRITSAFWSANERAGATRWGSSSETTPLPIGVGSTGKFVRWTNRRTSLSARA